MAIMKLQQILIVTSLITISGGFVRQDVGRQAGRVDVRRPLSKISSTTEDVETGLSSSSQSSEADASGGAAEIATVAFPPPLSRVDRIKRAATFWSTVLPILSSYAAKDVEFRIREVVLGEELSENYKESEWDRQHEKSAELLAQTIRSLKGFYVKTAQIIASRQDLFPAQYTQALSEFTDTLDPMPASMAKAVVCQEILLPDETFEDVFAEFDDEPLGAASVAQVHRAVFTEAYGGREVAIKIQRPSIESKLMGDIANLKQVALTLEDIMPVDYYTVFSELENQLADEFDFVKEAVAMDRIYGTMTSPKPDGSPADVPTPLVMPRPITASRRVLIMDFLRGVPLSRAREEMKKRGVDPDGPEAKLFGRKLLSSLTNVFGRTILETGFFHADCHPGNVFTLENGDIGLIDFGQCKQISTRNRETLCKVMIALDDRETDDDPYELEKIGKLAADLGVEFNDDAPGEAYAAVAMWLFDGSVEKLPGGYDKGELNPNSPLKEIASFPQDLVLVGRAAILIKGLSNRLGIPWSLSKEWAPIARQVLASKNTSDKKITTRVRFRDVVSTFRRWGNGKVSGIALRLPAPLRTRVSQFAVKVQERRERKRFGKIK